MLTVEERSFAFSYQGIILLYNPVLFFLIAQSYIASFTATNVKIIVTTCPTLPYKQNLFLTDYCQDTENSFADFFFFIFFFKNCVKCFFQIRLKKLMDLL